MRRPNGFISTVDPATERPVTYDTVRCVHCGRHDAVLPGSKRIRKFCANCGGTTCTSPACVVGCVPAERRLENLEHGRPELVARPVQVRGAGR